MNLTKSIQRAVIRSAPYPPFRWAYWMAYGAMLCWLIMRLHRMPEIHRLELRAPSKGHRFGSSDLDVRAEAIPLGGAEFFALADRLGDVLLPSRRFKRILDFYLFGAGEAILQRRLGPIAFSDARWIRLLGTAHRDSVTAVNASTPEVDETVRLGRAMYEYGCLAQELFEAPPDLAVTWTLYRRMTRIDDFFASTHQSLDRDCASIRERVRSRADGFVKGGALRTTPALEMQELFAVALNEVDSIASSGADADEGDGRDFAPVADAIEPANLRDAASSCSGAIGELCSQLPGLVESAILGCVPATFFDFRVYLVVPDGLSAGKLFELFRAIRHLYTAPDSHRMIPSTWLRLRHPTVLTRSMWHRGSRWYHAMRPVEEFYFFKRHAVLLWGRDPRDAADTPPASIDVIRSAAVAAADLRNAIWEAHHSRRLRQLMDALLGRLPALWLLLARSTIATSPEEALAGCETAGFPQISILGDLRRRVAGLHPQNLSGLDDNWWKPALEASGKWMDEIVALALARLEAHPGAVQSRPRQMSA